jgi:hypothetical protein
MLWLLFQKWRLTRKVAKQEKAFEGRAFEFVGMVTISWAFLEMGLDLGNELIMAHAGGDAIQAALPVSLNPKIKFIRKAFQNLPKLEPFRKEALSIVDGVSNLKEQRHDMVHGFTSEYLPRAAREISRIRYLGNTLSFETRTYSITEVMQLNVAIVDLAKRAIALAYDMGRQFDPANERYQRDR